MKRIIFFAILLLHINTGWSQNMDANSDQPTGTDDPLVYIQPTPYEVPLIKSPPSRRKAKIRNVILLIGDGMGSSQVYAGLVANHGALFLQNCPVAGFSKTFSANNLITDSAAGATALSIGKKTKNGAIGVDENDVPHKTILEKAEEKGLATGLVSTCDITHATPASFIAHQVSRGMAQEIAADFLKTDIDCFIGGGLDQFVKRQDGRDLTEDLKNNDYRIITSPDQLILNASDIKIAGLVAPSHLPPVSQGRGSYLQDASSMAINLLNRNKAGFFLMIEGSQIDWGGHANNTGYIAQEMLDFDKTIGQVLDFAAQDKQTLVIITADHETGGFAINGGELASGAIKGGFTTGSHTGVMVPVFAFGPGAERFGGIIDNTDIYHKMVESLGLD